LFFFSLQLVGSVVGLLSIVSTGPQSGRLPVHCVHCVCVSRLAPPCPVVSMCLLCLLVSTGSGCGSAAQPGLLVSAVSVVSVVSGCGLVVTTQVCQVPLCLLSGCRSAAGSASPLLCLLCLPVWPVCCVQVYCGLARSTVSACGLLRVHNYARVLLVSVVVCCNLLVVHTACCTYSLLVHRFVRSEHSIGS
jgi:hypothetical protein